VDTNDFREETLQRLTRVETRLEALAKNTEKLVSDYSSFRKEFYENNLNVLNKIAELRSDLQSLRGCNGLSKKEKAVLYAAFITGIFGVVTEVVRALLM